MPLVPIPDVAKDILGSVKCGISMPPIVSDHLKTARQRRKPCRAERKINIPENAVGYFKIIFVGVCVLAVCVIGRFVKASVTGDGSCVVHLNGAFAQNLCKLFRYGSGDFLKGNIKYSLVTLFVRYPIAVHIKKTVHRL